MDKSKSKKRRSDSKNEDISAEVKIIKRLSNAKLLIEDLEGHVSLADHNELKAKVWLTRSGAESEMGSAEQTFD
jgi:hypothetical protein